jgi:hypothetical protein
MLKIHSIEITNICNINCWHCPSSKSKYPKGFISLDTFKKAVEYVEEGNSFHMQMFGEAFLHKDLNLLLSIAKEAKTRPMIHSNGTLLTEDNVASAAANGLIALQVSIHSKRSLEGYIAAINALQYCPSQFQLFGKVLSCYRESLKDWAKELNMTETQYQLIYEESVHNWAMEETSRSEENVIETKTRCAFFCNNECIVRWDGNVTTCCFDSEGKNVIGNIDNFENLSFENIKTPLCYTCSPSWVNAFMD